LHDSTNSSDDASLQISQRRRGGRLEGEGDAAGPPLLSVRWAPAAAAGGLALTSLPLPLLSGNDCMNDDDAALRCDGQWASARAAEPPSRSNSSRAELDQPAVSVSTVRIVLVRSLSE